MSQQVNLDGDSGGGRGGGGRMDEAQEMLEAMQAQAALQHRILASAGMEGGAFPPQGNNWW